MTSHDHERRLREHTAVVVLAAGASRRLGTPKQALLIAGETLLLRSVGTALSLSAAHCLVVLDARDLACERELAELPLRVLKNPDADQGMSSSVRLALQAARQLDPALRAIVFTVCDQPHVHAALLARLLEGLDSGAPIAASSYGGVLGVPAAFSASTFDELANLTGDEGARRVIRRDGRRVQAVPFEAGLLDIDRPEDVERLAEGPGRGVTRAGSFEAPAAMALAINEPKR